LRLDADGHDQLPIACTLPADRARSRLALIGGPAADALLDRRTKAGGVRRRFRDTPEVERRVREQAELESQCCAFLRFEIGRDDEALMIDITGPPDAQPVIE
jgi:hypothetical protein